MVRQVGAIKASGLEGLPEIPAEGKLSMVSAPAHPKDLDISAARSKKINWSVRLPQITSILSATVAGVLTTATALAMLSNPVGWGIVGGLLALSLIGVALVGHQAGRKEALKTFALSLFGFSFGVSAALVPISGLQLASGAAAAAVASKAISIAVGTYGAFMSGILFGMAASRI